MASRPTCGNRSSRDDEDGTSHSKHDIAAGIAEPALDVRACEPIGDELDDFPCEGHAKCCTDHQDVPVHSHERSAPYIATELATRFGLNAVGYCLTGAAVISFLALLSIHETKDKAL